MKKSLITVLALVLFSGISTAGVMDIGGDVHVRSLYRNNFDLTGDLGSENWFDTYLWVYFDAMPYPDVRAYVRIIAERDWAVEAEEDDSASIDLDLGFLELTKLWGSRADVIAGRQELLYGEGFLIGRNDPVRSAKYERSPRKAFDALKISYGLDPFTLDFFGSVIEEGFEDESEILLGTNLHYDYRQTATLDVGLFYKDPDDDSRTFALSIRGESDVGRFPGLRVKAEAVPQFGKHSAARDLSAFGGYAGVEYIFGHEHFTALPNYVFFNYYYMTGDDGTGDFGEFDPMYHDMFYGEVNQVNEALGLDTNARILNLGFGWHISPAVDLGFNLYGFKRNEPVGGTTDFGEEVDVKLTYRYTPDTHLVLTGGYFRPKPAFASTNALQLTAAVKLAF